MAFERLSACVEELRTGSSSAADLQSLHHKLLRELYSLERRWTPELLTPKSTPASATAATTKAAGRKLSGGNGQLFLLLLQALTVYSGSHANNSSAGASGTATTMSLGASSSAPPTSESVLSLLCDLLVRTFDYSAVPVLNETLTSKHTTIYVKTSLAVVVSKLPLSDAVAFTAEVVAFATKTIKSTDYYMKQLLLESVGRMLDHDLVRLAALQPDALRLVTKTFQDKVPEVRVAAAGLLLVLARHTTPGPSPSSSAIGAGSTSSSGAGATGAHSTSSNIASVNGNSNATTGVTQDALMHVAIKGMDDASAAARCAFATVVGLVLAKFATTTSERSDTSDSSGVGLSSLSTGGNSHESDHDAAAARAEPDASNSSVSHTNKSKLAFKMPSVHLSTHLNLPTSLSRRKATAAAVHFSPVANIISFVRETIASRFWTSASASTHGGVLAALAIALASLLTHLPVDTLHDAQFRAIVDALLSVVDHPFGLNDLTRARNCVGFVLRFGLFPCLTERQHEALLGAYVAKLDDEVAAAAAAAASADDSHMQQQQQPHHQHHKLLIVLVEIAHMLHAMGEASVSHASDVAATLQVLLAHEKQSVRFQASVALASLVTALPYKLNSTLSNCIRVLRDTAALLLIPPLALERTASGSLVTGANDAPADTTNSDATRLAQLYVVQGRAAAIAHMLRALTLEQQTAGGVAHRVLSDVLALAEQLIESQFVNGCSDSVWLTCTRAGWLLIGSLVAVDDAHWVPAHTERLLQLWLRASELHTRESSLELLRIEAAVSALHAFLRHNRALVQASDSVELLAALILSGFLTATQERLSNPLKRRGQAARYRVITWLLKSFVLLPPIYSDAYIVLLDLIAEYTVAQSLTSLRQSPLVPAASTFVQHARASADDVLEVVATTRLVAGDKPHALYARELNLVLALTQNDPALSDTELEVQYLDMFWRSVCDRDSDASSAADHELDRATSSSSFTYVRLVDASVALFGRVFHFVPEELQLRCLQHFASALTDARANGASSTSVDVNVVSLLVAALHDATRTTTPTALATAVWPQQMQTMLCELLGSDDARVRRSAAEALGLLASLLSDAHCKALVHEIEKRLVADKAVGTALTPFSSSSGNSDSDASVVAAGAAFALACIKRACGSRVSIDTGLLVRSASDVAQPLRTWILHAWSLVVESLSATGGDYEPYIKTTLALLDAHVVAGFVYSKANKRNLRAHTSAQVALSRIVNAVVAVLGPELASSNKRLRELYTTWTMLRHNRDVRVELAYLTFLEQVVVFAPTKFRRTDLACILHIVSDAAAIVGAPSPTSASAPQLSPSMSAAASSSTVATRGTQHQPHAQLQRVALSCIRTLVERDPTHIGRQQLRALLFHALHVECTGRTWQYLPSVHGLADDLAIERTAAASTSTTTTTHDCSSSATELRATILALIDVDCANAHSHELLLWALLCRSIAVGESGASSLLTGSSSSADQLMMSPKGIDLPGLAASTSMRTGSFADGTMSVDDWSSFHEPPPTATTTESDRRVVLASDAIAAQVAVWRRTKRVVQELIAALPPLARPVRHFAIECVLRVFKRIATSGATLDAARHFDLAASRVHFRDRLAAGGAAPSAAATDPPANFVCMYLDEFVTLACHAATASSDGSELQMFQSVGLRLLRVLVQAFANAHDPEVPTGDAFVLDPYQAQVTSAIRQALKQAQQQQPTTATASCLDVYAPLLIEAYGISGGAIASRLVQDKVALGRILKMVVARSDFGHAHFVGDERTRATLALANVACLAQLLSTSVARAVEPTDENGSVDRRVAASPLVKVFVATVGPTAHTLWQCWHDATLVYGALLRNTAHWPRTSDKDNDGGSLIGGRATIARVLQTLLPLAPPAVADAFRDVFRRYWPHVLQAVVVAQTHVPSLFATTSTTDEDSDNDASHCSNRLLLAIAVFHVDASSRSSRDRDERSAEKLVAVLQSLPLLLRRLEQDDAAAFLQLYQSAVQALVNAALRSIGDVRLAALSALRTSLTRETIARCVQALPTTDPDSASEAATDPFDTLLAQAALCPAEVLRHMCEPSRVAQCTTTELLAVVRLATAGVVLLHTTERVRRFAVYAIGIVCQCARRLEDRVELHDAVVGLSRAAIESTLAFAKTLAPASAASSAASVLIRTELRASASRLVRWLLDDLVVARERSNVTGLDVVLRLLHTAAVAHPPALVADDMAALHAAIAAAVVDALDMHVRDGAQRNVLFGAHVLHGVATIVKKFVDANDSAAARVYWQALGPSLVQLVLLYARSVNSIASADAVRELVVVEELLRLLATQIDDRTTDTSGHGAALVRLVLPQVAAILQTHAASEQRAAIATCIAKLLLAFAQTRAAAFKDVVVAMDPALRSVLEASLRQALTGGGSGNSNDGAAIATSASSTGSTGAVLGKPLDLSRYG